MIYIIFSISMALSFGLGAFFTLKAVQYGLKFRVQVENGEPPKMDRQEAKEAKEVKEEMKINKFTQEQIKEWMYGVGGD